MWDGIAFSELPTDQQVVLETFDLGSLLGVYLKHGLTSGPVDIISPERIVPVLG